MLISPTKHYTEVATEGALSKSVLKYFAKFTKSTSARVSFLMGLWHRCFPKKFENTLITPFVEHLRRQLLVI